MIISAQRAVNILTALSKKCNPIEKHVLIFDMLVSGDMDLITVGFEKTDRCTAAFVRIHGLVFTEHLAASDSEQGLGDS